MTYPEIIYQHLQNIIQREVNYATRNKVVKSPQRKRIVTLQDVANALLYFEGGSLAKELKRAGLDMTPSAFIQRRHQLHSGVFQDVLAAFGAQDMDYETFQGYLGHCKSNKRALPCEIGYRDGISRVEIYSLHYAYPREK